MGIIMPTVGADISASVFGVPVAIAVNELKEGPLVVGKIATVNQPNLTVAYTDITGMSVTFTAKASRIYRIDYSASVTGTAAGWVLVQVSGGGIPNQQAFASIALSNNASYAQYGHYCGGCYYVGAGYPYTFTPGSITLKLQTNAAPLTWNISGTCILSVIDIGGLF